MKRSAEFSQLGSPDEPLIKKNKKDNKHCQSYERNDKQCTIYFGDFKNSRTGRYFSDSYIIGDHIVDGLNSTVYKGE